MALNPSFPGPSGVTDATALRKGLAGLVVRDAAGNGRPGIFPRHANAIVTGRADMALNVAAFEGVSVRGGGPLLLANDGAAVSPMLAAAPSSNSRIDVLYFKQNESAAPYADANNLPVFGVVTGAAAPIPVKPALTVAGAVELATITIPSTATTTLSSGVVITQTFLHTAAAGGVVSLRNQAEQDAYSPADGSPAYRTDQGRALRRRGGAWVADAGELYAEFTMSMNGVPDLVIVAAGSVTLVPQPVSTDSSFATPAAGGVNLTLPGLYVIDVTAALSSMTTGRTFLDIEAPGDTKRTSVNVAEDSFGGTRILRVTTPTLVQIRIYKTSSNVNNISGRIRVLKVG